MKLTSKQAMWSHKFSTIITIRLLHLYKTITFAEMVCNMCMDGMKFLAEF